jgi:hypothetical protein
VSLEGEDEAERRRMPEALVEVDHLAFNKMHHGCLISLYIYAVHVHIGSIFGNSGLHMYAVGDVTTFLCESKTSVWRRSSIAVGDQEGQLTHGQMLSIHTLHM